MNEFIPNVSEEDLTRILERDFPLEFHSIIRQAFNKIETQEKLRVIAACLKNSNRDVDKLLKELENANGFWREIISEAEYPKIKKSQNMTEQQINERRKFQYEQWFSSLR